MDIYSPDDLRKLAGTELSNYGGYSYPSGLDGDSPEEFEGNNFDGFPEGFEGNNFNGDDLVSVDGGQPGTFNPSTDGLRQFTFRIVSALQANESFYVWPGPANLTGTMTDGTFAGIGGGNLSGTSLSDETIATFVAWIQRNPTQLIAIKANSSTAGQSINSFTYVEVSPFRREPGRTLRLSNAQDQGTLTTTIAAVETTGVIACSDSRLSYQVLAGATVTIDLFFGPTANLSAALQRKAQRAGFGVKPNMLPGVGGRGKAPVMIAPPRRKR